MIRFRQYITEAVSVKEINKALFEFIKTATTFTDFNEIASQLNEIFAQWSMTMESGSKVILSKQAQTFHLEGFAGGDLFLKWNMAGGKIQLVDGYITTNAND